MIPTPLVILGLFILTCICFLIYMGPPQPSCADRGGDLRIVGAYPVQIGKVTTMQYVYSCKGAEK